MATTNKSETDLHLYSWVVRLWHSDDPWLWMLQQEVNGDMISVASGYATARDEGYMMAEEEAVRLGTSGRIGGDEANGYHFGPPSEEVCR